jgi:GH35 family endo-1,4-beta-xylanase
MNRRTFLKATATSIATSALSARIARGVTPATEEARGLGAEDATAAKNASRGPHLRVILQEADGSPLDHERARLLIARDMAGDAFPVPIDEQNGMSLVGLAKEPLQICVRLKVPNFGEVYCFADNDGKGYTRDQQVDFVVDAATTRLRRVREAIESHRALGVPTDLELQKHLEEAARPIPKEAGAARTAAAYESLAHGLHAGERFTLNLARYRITNLAAPRKDFGFGILVHADVGGDCDKHVAEAFNFGSCGWGTWKDEAAARTDAPLDYARADHAVDYCKPLAMTPKVYGYLYGAKSLTPPWIKPEFSTETTAPAVGRFKSGWGFDELRALYKKIVHNTAVHYRGRAPYMEVMNEAHDKANIWRLTHEQILEMARTVFTAARDGDPNVKRQMNHCCLWGEYAKTLNPDGSRMWTPYRYIRDCFDNGVDCEVIGLQLYYPQYDLFEIDRMLSRFIDFKRKLHITEMSTQSVDGQDPQSMRPTSAPPGWHGPWNETMQADWLEAIYTIAYSKPEFECVGWWDLADVPGKFWPHGGLLHRDYTPKESFHRLLKLQEQWGVKKQKANA